jgi:hypothetical protein
MSNPHHVRRRAAVTVGTGEGIAKKCHYADARKLFTDNRIAEICQKNRTIFEGMNFEQKLNRLAVEAALYLESNNRMQARVFVLLCQADTRPI